MSDQPIPHCPLCNEPLHSKKCGYVCKNHQCIFYWKSGDGWCLHDDSVWYYMNKGFDQIIAWDERHPMFYCLSIEPTVPKRHLKAMDAALRKNGELQFIIPTKVSSNGKVVQKE